VKKGKNKQNKATNARPALPNSVADRHAAN
jgi:hypothetical protein